MGSGETVAVTIEFAPAIQRVQKITPSPENTEEGVTHLLTSD
jgi:hypothetical protein